MKTLMISDLLGDLQLRDGETNGNETDAKQKLMVTKLASRSAFLFRLRVSTTYEFRREPVRRSRPTRGPRCRSEVNAASSSSINRRVGQTNAVDRWVFVRRLELTAQARCPSLQSRL